VTEPEQTTTAGAAATFMFADIAGFSHGDAEPALLATVLGALSGASS
jgi:hypothetical protein